MVLLIDTNVLLDVLLDRPGFVKSSDLVWKLCETEQVKGYVSTLSYANIMYIMRKQLTAQQIEDVFHKLNLIFEFASFTPTVLERAVTMKWDDFEDAIQSATAESVHADYIITRNIKDFAQSKVIAFTPDELLARI
jgi:predicted nucleic acid-binding protein